MKRLSGSALLGLLVAFLTLFLLLPMASLVLAGFTGEPVNLLGYLGRGDLGGLFREIADRAELKYYLEFLSTRRYRQGFLNAVGLAPFAAVLAFAAARTALVPVGRVAPALASRLRRLAGFPLAGAVFLAVVVVAVGWRPWLPAEVESHHWLRYLVPGRTWDLRLLQALGFCPLVTLAASTLGVAVALALSRTAMPLRRLVRVLCVLPLAIPPFLGALAFRNLLGDGGILTRALGLAGVGPPFESQSVLAAGIVQTFLFFPFVVLTTAAALDREDPSLGEAAEVLGARPGFAWWTVRFQALLPGLAAGAFLVFLRSFDDFAALSLLMPVGYKMIVVEAYRDLSGSTNWGGASVLSTVMVVTILGLLAVQKYFAEGGREDARPGPVLGGEGPLGSPWLGRAALAFCSLVLAVPLLFVASMVLVSLSADWGTEILPTSYTLGRYAEIARRLGAPHSPLFNSFALVLPGLLGSMVAALLVAWTVARSRHWTRHLLDFATVLPFVVPGVAFAVALIGLFNGPPLALHLTATLVIASYVVTRMPYGVRSTLASLQQVGPWLEESSRTLGAPDGLTLVKVTLPLILPGLAAGALMVFISAMQEVAITWMTCPPNWYPTSVYVFQRIQEGDVFGASTYGVVLLVLTLVPYALAVRLGGVRASL